MATTLTRLLTIMTLGGLLMALSAGPALAHGRGSDASNYESTITATGDVNGLTWTVINGDEYLQVTNTTDQEVLIPGYSSEPYLRIGPDGVFRNLNSQATYVNEDRFGQTVVPTDIDPDGEPEWEQVSGSDSYAWHDHRIHWMAGANPPGVQADPDAQQLVNAWTVPFTLGELEAEVTGDLVWVPGGSPWIWLVPALLVVAAPVAYGMARSRPDTEAGEWRGLSRMAGATLLVLALMNVIHLIDDVFATPIPLSESAVSAIQTLFFIAIAVFGAVRAMQGREGAFTALGVGSGAVFIGQGLLYISVLSASQTASVFPGWLTRVVIAASVAQVLPMAVAAVVGTRALLPDFDDEELAAEASAA